MKIATTVVVLVNCVLALGCQEKSSPASPVKKNITISTTGKEPFCNEHLFPVVEVWNETVQGNLIETFQEGKIKDGYFKSEGWDSDTWPYPKKFDLKLTVINNLLLYDNEEGEELGDWKISVSMRLKTAQNADYLYPLNATVSLPIKLLEKHIEERDFTSDNESVDIWIKGIELEKHILESQAKERFINALIILKLLLPIMRTAADLSIPS
jgi:hypothetical protein